MIDKFKTNNYDDNIDITSIVPLGICVKHF